MIDADKRSAIFALHQEGMGLRELSWRLRLGRNTVRRIIRQQGRMPAPVRAERVRIDPQLLETLYKACDGRAQRVHEKLVEEEGIEVTYPTLTRRLREMGISAPAKSRCDQVPDEPGAEMQHDTTVYTIKLDGRPVRLVASLLYLRYSKRRYLKFYRAFNRFKMKSFLHEALTFWAIAAKSGWICNVGQAFSLFSKQAGGTPAPLWANPTGFCGNSFWGYAARDCIIDNTNLARLRGTGQAALIVPEMERFGASYGFRFLCHEIGHANRKAGEERSFWTVETNFLPGRTFRSLEDLNTQAFEWATVRMEHRPQGKARLVPAKAFEHEQSYLIELPAHLPAPYKVHERGTDQYGYAAFEGNYYWVPGTKREDVKVLQYADRLKLYRARECLAEYPLPADGVKNAKFAPPGQPQPRHNPSNRRRPTEEEEKRLRAMDESVGRYLDFALKPKGIARHHFLRQLFALSREISPEVFLRVIERALRYRIVAMPTLQRKALLSIYDAFDYMANAQNIIWVGPTGCGKTGLATAFLIDAVNRGYNGRFVTFAELVGDLRASGADYSEAKILKQYLAPDCLLIDELGYIEIEPAQVGLFFTLMQRRHRKRPTLITSNLGFSDWRSFLKNDHLTVALIDRLTSNSYVFNMKDCRGLRPAPLPIP